MRVGARVYGAPGSVASRPSVACAAALVRLRSHNIGMVIFCSGALPVPPAASRGVPNIHVKFNRIPDELAPVMLRGTTRSPRKREMMSLRWHGAGVTS